jgi:hypothetical protein
MEVCAPLPRGSMHRPRVDPHLQAIRVHEVHRVADRVPVQVRISSQEADGILDGPSPDLRVVVARAEAGEAGVGVVEATREAEGLEPRAGVARDVPEFVVVEPLSDRAGGRVHDESHRSEVVGEDSIRSGALDQEIRRRQLIYA